LNIPCFKPFDPASPPADVAQVTAASGESLPFIVRVERGTLNHGIYDIAVIDVPGTR
jgi:hypothetical protein